MGLKMANPQSFLRLLVCALVLLLAANFIPAAGNAWANDSDIKTFEVDGKKSEEIWLNSSQGRFRFTAEIADDNAKRATGLMFREKMAPTHGMLFDFGGARRIQMWMRNTPLSLDMIFLNEQGIIQKIARRTTPFSDDIIDSDGPITHVLEINGGVSSLLGLRIGDRIEHRLFIKK